jgi:hypothetical protein
MNQVLYGLAIKPFPDFRFLHRAHLDPSVWLAAILPETRIMPGGLSLSRQHRLKGLCWGHEVEGLARSSVELGSDRVEFGLGAVSEAGLARQVLAQETVGVLAV